MKTSRQAIIHFPEGIDIRKNEPMKAHTTFHVGGPADYFVRPQTVDGLRETLVMAQKNAIPCTIMGSGSNFLVRDHGIRGIVISLAKLTEDLAIEPHKPRPDIEKKRENPRPIISADTTEKTAFFSHDTNKIDAYRVTASAGMQLSALCKKTMALKLEDLSFAAGIPGTVGGAIMMNAGTGLGTISRHLHSIEILDGHGNVKTLEKCDLKFSHRTLHFPDGMDKDKKLNSKCPERKRFSKTSPIILNATFLLTKGNSDKLNAAWQDLMDRRKASQPTGVACAGCFFKNPDDGNPAGWLIDQAGLKKKRVGGAMVSDIHANFIVNTGNATAKDILDLQDIVQKTVKSRFGITLSPEVIITGE